VGGALRTDQVRLGGGTQAAQDTYPYEQALDPEEFCHAPHQRHRMNQHEQRDSVTMARRHRHPLCPPDLVPHSTLSAV
jgi:hypothetical protein